MVFYIYIYIDCLGGIDEGTRDRERFVKQTLKWIRWVKFFPVCVNIGGVIMGMKIDYRDWGGKMN